MNNLALIAEQLAALTEQVRVSNLIRLSEAGDNYAHDQLYDVMGERLRPDITAALGILTQPAVDTLDELGLPTEIVEALREAELTTEDHILAAEREGTLQTLTPLTREQHKQALNAARGS